MYQASPENMEFNFSGLQMRRIASPYTVWCTSGKIFPNDEEGSVSKRVVMHLVKPFLGVGRNITTDDWFSFNQLADGLNAAKTTQVGTIR